MIYKLTFTNDQSGVLVIKHSTLERVFSDIAASMAVVPNMPNDTTKCVIDLVSPFRPDGKGGYEPNPEHNLE